MKFFTKKTTPKKPPPLTLFKKDWPKDSEISKETVKSISTSIQEFQKADTKPLRTNFLLLSAMHEKSTDNNEKEQLNILMAKAIATRVEDDPMPIILRKTLIPPIWIPKTATEKEAVTTFMAQQMTALNEATFTAFAQTRILEQPLEAASNKTLYNLQKEISPPHFRFIQHSFITQFND